MFRATADVREIIESIEVQTAGQISILGDSFEVLTTDGTKEMTSLLASSLYQRLYCRPWHGRVMRMEEPRVSRVFIDRLSQANSGTGTWEPGWAIRAIDDDGTLEVSKLGDDLTLWAHPGQFRPADGSVALGSVGRIRLGKELRGMLPGYYTALGNADQAAEVDGSHVKTLRFYWHLTAENAPNWVRELTHRFNMADVSFHAKLLNDPNAYMRADAGVLYVALADAPRVMALLPGLHQAISRSLRSTTPMFTKRLARGLSIAEDPGGGRSFGQHRCQLVAEGLVRAFQGGETTFESLTQTIAARFAEEGLTVTQPWLSPGSRQRYVWPTQPFWPDSPLVP